MTSDRARISWDRTRTWRSVVAQQGRVTLEADVNEASTIAQEARREEILDIVGPTGTPDDGYKVAGAGGGDITLSPGTLYLGGWRLELDQPLLSSAQPDWLDAPEFESGSGAEVVLLRALEQEVTAVEDQALREVALGGPDTAARTRLLQHVVRLHVKATDCAGAAEELGKRLAVEGLSLDPHSLQLLYDARLQVGFVPPDPMPGPCDPPAQGGYLGADNQLIRVTVTDFDAETGKGTLLWGWNNASFLYRATAPAPDKLVLAADPLDAEHTPRVGQPVEVLRTRVTLGGADYIAALDGEVLVLGTPYTPLNRTITLPSALPANYANDPNGPLFVRLWEAEVDFISGQPALLDPSGLEVTITMNAWPGKLAGRPFWTFAVRPSTPIDVYPARYGQAPQPPEGPRQWFSELAVIGWKGEKFTLLEDCRLPFLPLTQQTQDGCCGIVLGPDDLTAGRTLQHVIDQASKDGPATITLRPGKYILHKPLRLGPQHRGLVLEGCRDGAVLQADEHAGKAFVEGVIVMLHADQVVLRDLRIQMPLVPWKIPQGKKKTEEAFVSVGVMAVRCAGLRIERCLFRYRVPQGEHLVAVGVYGRSECQGLDLRDNLFLHDEMYRQDDDIERYLLGYALTPDTTQTTLMSRDGSKPEAVAPDAWLDDATIQGNRFDGLTLPVLVMAGLGRIDCIANTVRNSVGGFYFFSSDLGATLELARAVDGFDDKALSMAFEVGLNPDLLELAARLGQVIPRPAPHAEGQYTKGYKVFSQKIISLQAQAFREQGRKAFEDFSARNMVNRTTQETSTAPTAAGAPQAPEAMVERAEVRPADGVKETLSSIQARHESLDQVYHIAIQARLLGTDSRPVLRIQGNDIEASGQLMNGKGKDQNTTEADHKAELEALERAKKAGKESGESYMAAPVENRRAGLTAINAVFEYRDDEAQVMLQDNRVALETQSACAAAILLPNLAVATGNLFIQPNDPINIRAPCFVLAGDLRRALLDVMGNLVRGRTIIWPERSSSGDTASWDFLNTVD